MLKVTHALTLEVSMRKILFILLFAAGACEAPQQVNVSNQCIGSWMRIVDGNGDVLASRLAYGEKVHIELDRFGSGNVTLEADGYRISNNTPLGSASVSYWVSKGNGSPTGPRYDEWVITYLTTTDPNGGCQGK
ncbi:MAG: hypothetical protein JWL80_146 [Parcubacteria group bacterium]|nr:hypothetical protein [Parcubacteria group bacterium]